MMNYQLTDRAKAYAKTQPDVLQFKRSMEYLQKSTGLTLQNLYPALEHLAAIIYMEGWRDAIVEQQEVRKETKTCIVKS